jgi:ABC-2 type transport system ATP-binding protein
MALLQVEDLSLSYGQQKVLNHISFSFEKGKIIGLLGPNGAGKSSIIKILAGLVFPETGILYYREARKRSFSELREHCSYLIDSPAFYPFLSGKQNLKLIKKINNNKSDIDGILSQVGLASAGKKKVKNYSTGMKQRLSIAQAMMRNSELLILDEPFNGLDPNGFQDLMSLLRNLNQKGTTIVVSSHLLNELEQFADVFILLYKGAIAFQTDKKELMTAKKSVAFTFEKKPDQKAMVYFEDKESSFESETKVILKLDPNDIAKEVQELVGLNCTPINVEIKNILQEKYLEITI